MSDLLSRRAFAVCAFLLTTAAGQSAFAQAKEEAAPSFPLPNGASTLTETYDDWVLDCRSSGQAAGCALIQTISQRDGQRVLTFSVNPLATDNGYSANMITPFGLEVTKGVSLAIDDKAFGEPRAFKTCLPAGCVVPLPLSASDFQALQQGTTLKLTAQTAADEAFTLDASLKGFKAASERAAALKK